MAPSRQALYDLLGIDDQLGANTRVAAVRREHRAAMAAPAAFGPSATPAQIRDALVSRFPGVPAQGLRGWPLGFSTVQFAAATLTVLTATATPQRPFQGNRLVVDIARTGATATGLVTVNTIRVGTTPQQISNQPNVSSMFLATAVGIMLELEPAQPGIQVQVDYGISALPAAADTVDIGTSLMNLTGS